jgi:alpha-methylacyl-CoA racemase
VVARGRPTVTVDIKDPDDLAGTLALLSRADALIASGPIAASAPVTAR